MNYWLLKSEPDVYSINDLQKDGKTCWTGVRNYLARNYMRDLMSSGDQFIFYHSNSDPSSCVGIGQISKTKVIDMDAFDKKSPYYDKKSKIDSPTWICVEVEFKGKFKKNVSLEELKKIKELQDISLLKKGQRLSVLPIKEMEFDKILKLGQVL